MPTSIGESEAAVDARSARCESCDVEGVHVDTTAGEVVERGDVVGHAPEGALYLMVDERGRLVCDRCA